MAQYLLNIVQPVGEVPPPEELGPVMKELAALNEEMQAAAVWVFAAALQQPEASTVVRAEDGDVLVTDGPYAEGKEFIGGFDVIEVEDLDEALLWAGRLARVLGGLPVEVRPVAQRF
ncbi:YciI family protein [Blastococcus montanus]|uniref:YciI family protein n=1 Tax=Blastococcus montanus TaxID=3144973 RepID=UPI00320A5496